MNAIVSMAFGEYEPLSRLTFPSFKSLAHRCHCEFIQLTDRTAQDPNYEKLQLYGLLSNYERVFWLDCDALVLDRCTNPFEIVPRGHFAAYDELPDHPESVEHVQRAQIELGCRRFPVTSYYNTGVFLIDACHRDLLGKTKEIKSPFTEQTHINIRLQQLKVPVQPLPWIYNCMNRPLNRAHIAHFSSRPLESRVRRVRWTLWRQEHFWR